jgi:hypothetical protein
MSLKSETVRVLSNVELKSVEGGAGTGYCAAAGGSGNPSSITSEQVYVGGVWVYQNYNFNYYISR